MLYSPVVVTMRHCSAVLIMLTFEFLPVIVGGGQSTCYTLSNAKQLCLSTGDGTVKTWHNAKTYCESQNGTLLNVVNAEIENTLKQFINDSNLFSRNMWIGVSAEDPDPAFHWVNGQPISNDLTISNPSDSSTGRRFACAEVSNGQLIYTANTYNAPFSFICEIDGSPCKTSDRNFSATSKCYRKNETSATWFEASNYCLGQGGRLATFDSVSWSEVANFLTSTLAITANTSYWVGLINSWWKTTCGEDALYTDWEPLFPLTTGTLSNYTYSPCVVFDSYHLPYGWQSHTDHQCYRENGFICQQGTPCSMTTTSTSKTTTTTITTTIKSNLNSSLSSSSETLSVGAVKANTDGALVIGVVVGVVGGLLLICVVIFVLVLLHRKQKLTCTTKNGDHENVNKNEKNDNNHTTVVYGPYDTISPTTASNSEQNGKLKINSSKTSAVEASATPETSVDDVVVYADVVRATEAGKSQKQQRQEQQMPRIDEPVVYADLMQVQNTLQ